MAARCHNERGLVIALTAGAILLFMLLLAIVVDLGVMYVAKRQIDGIAELTGRAAVVGFHESRARAYVDRVTAATQQAQAVAQANRVFGMGSNTLGTLQTAPLSGASGNIEYGVFHPETCGSDPCRPVPCGARPCFEANQPNGARERVNAVRVNLRTPLATSIRSFFAQFIGIAGSSVSASKIVTLAPRCAIFNLDLSNSMTTENYRPLNQFDPTQSIATIGPRSYYAFSEDAVLLGNQLYNRLSLNPNLSQMTYTQVLAAASNAPAISVTNTSLAWFSLMVLKPTRPPPGPIPSPATEHFADDYVRVPVKIGTTVPYYYIDAFRGSNHTGPEPFSSILEVLNGTITELRRSALVADYIQILGFDHDARGTNLVGRENFSLLQQITNLNNGPIKTALNPTPTTPIYPSFLSYGFLPREDASTNIFEALYQSIENLGDPDLCPENSEKHIFIISDFIFNVLPSEAPFPSSYPTGQTPTLSNGTVATYSNSFNGWEWIYNWSLPGRLQPSSPLPLHPIGGPWPRTRWPYEVNGTTAKADLPTLARTVGGGFSVHSIIVGDHVGPHLVDIQRPEWYQDPNYNSTLGNYRFYNYRDGVRAGQTLTARDFGTNFNRLYDGTFGSPADGPAYRPFLDPNGTAVWLSSNLNGTFCPLRPIPPSGECITDPHDPARQIMRETGGLRDQMRPNFFSPDCTPKDQQFAKCVQETFIRGIPVLPVSEYNK